MKFWMLIAALTAVPSIAAVAFAARLTGAVAGVA